MSPSPGHLRNAQASPWSSCPSGPVPEGALPFLGIALAPPAPSLPLAVEGGVSPSCPPAGEARWSSSPGCGYLKNLSTASYEASSIVASAAGQETDCEQQRVLSSADLLALTRWSAPFGCGYYKNHLTASTGATSSVAWAPGLGGQEQLDSAAVAS